VARAQPLSRTSKKRRMPEQRREERSKLSRAAASYSFSLCSSELVVYDSWQVMAQWGRDLSSSSDDCATGLLLAQEGFQLHYVEAPAATTITLLRLLQRQARARPTFGAVRPRSSEYSKRARARCPLNRYVHTYTPGSNCRLKRRLRPAPLQRMVAANRGGMSPAYDIKTVR